MTIGESTHAPVRIAFVITELDIGGAERCLTNIALGLDRARFTPVVYSLAPAPAADRRMLVDQLERAGIETHFVGANSVFDTLSAVRRLSDHFRRQCPQIVQTFLFHANVVGTLAARRARLRNVTMGIRVADPSWWRQQVERWCGRSARQVVCVSDSVASSLSWVRALPAEKRTVIPNGVDMTRIQDAPPVDLSSLGIPPAGKQVAVAVGRLDPQKGFDWLLELAPEILTRRADLEIVVVGAGPADSQLKSLADRFRISSRVHFTGWHSNVAGILKRSNLLLLPSRWEGMPNALLEAMAVGLPVVATRVEGVDELLGPAAPAQTVRFGDRQCFVNRVLEILENPSRAKSLGDENRRRVLSRFTLPQMIRSYENLYETLSRPRPEGGGS